MVIGVDIGYSYTKTSTGAIFPSRIRLSDMFSGDITHIDGTGYEIGVGDNVLDVNKIDNEATRILMFSALAKSASTNQFNVVTGLPIGQYKQHAEQFKQSIMKNNRAVVTTGGVTRTITIQDVKVYAQGAGALYSQPISGDVIIIDVGGRTVDIALFKVVGGTRSLTNSATLYSGILPLYMDVATEINKRHDLTLDYAEAEQALITGLTIDGERQSIEYVAAMVDKHIAPIMDTLALKYPYRTTPVYLCGGGAAVLYRPIKAKIKHAVMMKNYQFSNAIGFAKVGEKIWPSRQLA